MKYVIVGHSHVFIYSKVYPKRVNAGLAIFLGWDNGINIPNIPLFVWNISLKCKPVKASINEYYINPIIILFINYWGKGKKPPVFGKLIC